MIFGERPLGTLRAPKLAQRRSTKIFTARAARSTHRARSDPKNPAKSEASVEQLVLRCRPERHLLDASPTGVIFDAGPSGRHRWDLSQIRALRCLTWRLGSHRMKMPRPFQTRG